MNNILELSSKKRLVHKIINACSNEYDTLNDISELSEAIGGGFRKGTLNVFAADMGMGKTAFMNKLVKTFSEHKYTGLHNCPEGNFAHYKPPIGSYYAEKQYTSIKSIESHIKIAEKQNGKLDYICLDLPFITFQSKKKIDVTKLKTIAVKNDVPIIITQQLNQRANNQFKGMTSVSGPVVYIADTVIRATSLISFKMKCLIDKNRFGPNGQEVSITL
jgi:thymidine kinase